MSFVDPLRQPQTFARQAQDLVRASFSAPLGAAGPDPFAVIDAQIDASFERALAEAMHEPAPLPSASAPAAPSADGHALAPSLAGTTAWVPLPAPGRLSAQPVQLGWVVGSPAPLGQLEGSSSLAAASPLSGAERLGSADAPSSAPWEPALSAAAQRYDVPDWLVRSVVKAESGGNPRATSSVGAMGLMQLMPATARELGVQDAYDPAQNLDGGVRYLRRLLDQFDGDFTKAVAAYNAGPGTVARYGGVPPYAETQHYVQRVLGTTASYLTGDSSSVL